MSIDVALRVVKVRALIVLLAIEPGGSYANVAVGNRSPTYPARYSNRGGAHVFISAVLGNICMLTLSTFAETKNTPAALMSGWFFPGFIMNAKCGPFKRG